MLSAAVSGSRSSPLYGSNSSGFTLVEVLVAVGLIAAVAILFVQNQIENLNRRTAESLAQDMLSIANTSLSSFSDNGEWPDQDNDCQNLLTDLINANAYPPNYVPAMEVALSYNCSIEPDYGRVLRVTATYPRKSDRDHADLLLSYLPTSEVVEDDDGIPSVVHYVSQPRKASHRFHFHKESLATDAKFSIPKPDCLDADKARYILLPQAVCLGPNPDGLGGFYFKPDGDDDTEWNFVMMVAGGQANDSEGDYTPAPTDCGGDVVEVGAITYCD